MNKEEDGRFMHWRLVCNIDDKEIHASIVLASGKCYLRFDINSSSQQYENTEHNIYPKVFGNIPQMWPKKSKC